jgi:transposase InsO family protein
MKSILLSLLRCERTANRMWAGSSPPAPRIIFPCPESGPVGWMTTDRESTSLTEELIAAACVRQDIQPDQLTLHVDRGSSMRSKPVALLMADLGVTKTHSRPHASPWRRGDISNDNPFSEFQFKTLKYRFDGLYCCLSRNSLLALSSLSQRVLFWK